MQLIIDGYSPLDMHLLSTIRPLSKVLIGEHTIVYLPASHWTLVYCCISHFKKLVYFKNDEPSFPSESPKSLGRIVGIAEHVGHALTYKILDPSTNRIICRSEIRSAEDTDDHNKRLVPEHGEREPPRIVKSNKEPIIYSSDDHYSDPDAIVNNKDLIGRTFLLEPDTEGFVKRATIVDLLDKHIHDTENRSEHRQFKVSVNNDEYEDIMSYNEILSRLKADDENPIMWKYKCISGHQGPPRPSHSSYMGSSYNLNIEWKNGEITPEPLDIFAADDPVVRAIYDKQNNLLDISFLISINYTCRFYSFK